MEPNVVANLVREQGMLIGGIVAQQQHSRCIKNFAHGGGHPGFAVERARQRRIVGSAVVIHIVRLQYDAREF